MLKKGGSIICTIAVCTALVGLGLLVLPLGAATGDTLVTKGGDRWEGKVTETDDAYILVTPQGSRMRFPKEAVLEVIREAPPQGSEDVPTPRPTPEKIRAEESQMSKVVAAIKGLVGAGEDSTELVQVSKDERETFEAFFGKKLHEVHKLGATSAAVSLARELLEAAGFWRPAGFPYFGAIRGMGTWR